jgi:hypothetical protein
MHSNPVLKQDLYLHVSTSSLKMNRSRSRLKRRGIRPPASNVEEVHLLARKGIVLRRNVSSTFGHNFLSFFQSSCF